ncbi:MAG TPA: flippase-like domain-containing protein [Methanosarcina sp.]|jgi:hypothetical protein
MNRYKKLLIVAILISVTSIVLVTGLTFNSNTVEALSKIKPEYILAAVFTHLLFYIIWSFRTQALCKALGYRIRSTKIMEIIISSTFVAGITPSSAGGELLRIHLLNKSGIPLGRATAVIIGERLLDAIFISSCLPFALFILKGTLSNYRLNLVLVMASFLVLLGLFSFVYAIWKPSKMKHLIYWTTGKIALFFGKKKNNALSEIAEKIDREIELFHDSIRVFFSEGKKGLLWGIVYTLLHWFVDFSILVLILMGLSQTPSILTAFAAQVLLAVIKIIPATPGGSGVTELGATSIFSIFVGSSVLGITVLSWRSLTYYTNIVLGGFMSLKVFKDMDLIQKLTENSTE